MEHSENKTPQNKTPTKHIHHLRYTDFEFIKILGMGAYGKVELVQRKGIKYALKVIEKRTLAKEGKEYQAFIERELLRRMKHPGVVALKTCFQDRQNLYFCLEFCEGGDFITFINGNEEKVSQELRVFYVAEIVSIIEYFQTIQVVHRDLKPENILLSERGHLKIIDFATAEVTDCNLIDEKFKEQLTTVKTATEDKEIIPKEVIIETPTKKLPKEQTNEENKSECSSETDEIPLPQEESASRRRKATFVGTCYYVPPELLEEEACSPATDLWALGCITYQLYYLNPPFDGGSEFEVFEKIKNLDYSFPKNEKIPAEAIDLIQKLLKKNPMDRLGSNSREGLMMADLKSHKFFENVSFETLFEQVVPLVEEDESEKDKEKHLKTGDKFMKEYMGHLVDNQNILIHGIIEKRTFINYNVYYLIVFKNLKMLRIKVTEPGKTRETEIEWHKKLESKDNMPAEVLDVELFKLITKEKTYKLKCENPTNWVNVINEQYKEMRERKVQSESESTAESEIDRECKSISEMLKGIKVVMEE